MQNDKKVGILGYGEVGKAMASFYEDPFIQDLNGKNIADGVELDILHVCIPYVDKHGFHVAVKFAINKWAMGGLVFIHSTVPVGTTKEIAAYHPFVVHSPVRGIHPHLAAGIKTFTKYVGAENAGAARIALEHLEALGIPCMAMYKTETTELLKLLDTTYYGLAIAYHAYAARICEEVGVPFDMVMTEANRSYNLGYEELDKRNVIRPVLTPPEGGKIGGHCIIPNAAMLRTQFGDDAILETILRHK